MRAELYIAQLIRWNSKLREQICNWLFINNSENADSVAGYLTGESNIEQCAEQLQCGYDEVFLNLKDKISRLLNVYNLKIVTYPRLKQSDASLFLDESFIKIIAEGLICENNRQAVINNLFDTEVLYDKLLAAEIIKKGETTTFDMLFLRMISLDNINRIIDYYGGVDDIWSILFSLVKDESKIKLSKHFNCQQNQIFEVIAAKSRNQHRITSNTQSKIDDSQELDSIAVSTLQSMLSTIAFFYLKKSKDIAEQLWNSEVDYKSNRLLYPLILYYGDLSFKKALDMFIPSEQTIQSLILNKNFLSQPRYENNFHLQFIADNNKIHVQYRKQQDSNWFDLIEMECSDENIVNHILDQLPQISDNLKGAGETLHERILSMRIKAYLTLEHKAWSLFSENNPFVNAFVLGLNKLPDKTGVSEIFKSNEEFSTFEIPNNVKTECISPSELYQKIKEEYQKK